MCYQNISPVKHYQNERSTPWKNKITDDSLNENNPLKISFEL